MTTDAKLVKADEAARRAALDVEHSFIVQAPAGSGKTELLIQRYLKLLAEVDHPEEILAITFTRKAAAEMQLRVLEALLRAVAGEVPSEPHERITAEAASRALARDRDRQWNIVANPRRLRIQTLDSLNASVARARPLSSAGGASGSSVIADAEMHNLYRQAAALTLDQLTESGPYRDVTEHVLRHVDTNTGLYLDYLARMLATRDQWLPFVGSGQLDDGDASRLRRDFEDSLRRLVQSHFDELTAVVPQEARGELRDLAGYAGRRLRDEGQPGNPICSALPGGTLPAARIDDADGWRGIAELLLTGQGGWRKQVNKNQGFPPADDGEKQRMRELLESFQDEESFRARLHEVRQLPPAGYSEEQWEVLVALFRLLPLTVVELKRLFAERGVCDHIEVALNAADALGTADEPGDVALLLDYQLRHLLVDEMQDTSSAQYRMLEALTGGWSRDDKRTLFCVGDPMQSIYRFRNAEVGQFLLAQDAGIGNVELTPLTLRRNFRSGEVLVDWFNRVFPSVLAARDDPARSAVSYSAAVSVPKLAGQGECRVHPLRDADEAAEADAGCRVIADILASNPGEDVAVLVRSRTQLPRLLHRLRTAGIVYRAVEIDRLTDLPEIIDVLALTRALVHHGDRLAWLAILRSPWLGLNWTDLHALVRNDTASTVWELLHDEERLAQLSSTGRAAVRTFVDRMGSAATPGRDESLRDRVERVWLSLGGAAIPDDANAIENVYRYLDVIEKLEVGGSLPDVAELEAVLDTEHVSSDVDARLQVMTMHRAKGLQFDHVLLFGLGRISRPSVAEVMSWIELPDSHGESRLVISPVGPRADVERDPIHRYIGLAENEKDRHEQGRLLYVACTRARKSLHLLGHARLLKSGLKPDPRSLLHLLWPVVAPDFEAAVEPESRHSAVAEQDDWQLPVLRRFASPWTLPEAPRLPCSKDVPAGAGETPTVDYYWVGAGARFAGTVVHRWLQRAADGRAELEAGKLHELRPITERWLREMGVGAGMLPDIMDRIEAALSGIVSDDRGRWLLSGEGHAEYALSGILHGRVESVVIDRVRVDSDGTHWVVDYKTSTHEGGNLDDFLSAETGRYRAQLRKYAELYRNYSGAEVRCALYFPLLREFVEVEIEA